MVSIPDWSRLGRLLEAPRESVTPGARYYKQREVEAVKQVLIPSMNPCYKASIKTFVKTHNEYMT